MPAHMRAAPDSHFGRAAEELLTRHSAHFTVGRSQVLGERREQADVLAWPPKADAKQASAAINANQNRLAHPLQGACSNLPGQCAEQVDNQVEPAVASIDHARAGPGSGVLCRKEFRETFDQLGDESSGHHGSVLDRSPFRMAFRQPLRQAPIDFAYDLFGKAAKVSRYAVVVIAGHFVDTS
jgi:hypothetical protein